MTLTFAAARGMIAVPLRGKQSDLEESVWSSAPELLSVPILATNVTCLGAGGAQ